MEEGKGPVDTSHLYEGKVVRSSAPSRKRAAGTLKADSGIPDDAVPDRHTKLDRCDLRRPNSGQ